MAGGAESMKTTVLTGSWLSVVVFSVLAVTFTLPGCSSRLVSSDPPGKSEEAEVEVAVTRTTDGDTVKISPEVDGEDRVRLIGVDTPETTGRMPEPYGEEAARFTRETLEGRDVSLEFDAEREDDYGRLLAYAYLPDSSMFNEALLREGYAQVATFPPNTRYLERFEEAQEEAREARRGLWGLPEGELCRIRDRGNGIGGGCE